MSPALIEKYPDFLPEAAELSDEDLDVAKTAVKAVKEELERRGSTKEWPIPDTVIQRAAEMSDNFPADNIAVARAAASIAIIESKIVEQPLVPDLRNY